MLASLGVRNLAGYNRKVKDAAAAGEPLLDPTWKPDEYLANDEQERPELETLPFIVVVIDEFADMMMIVGKKVEELIARIAQKARAAGIHLVLATQRPSVDVITGLIKANIPTRMSFQVSSKIDSRTVLDQGGAEQLLGHGDMLYLPPGSGLPVRVHGAFVDDDEVHRVVSAWKARGEPVYVDDVLNGAEGESLPGVPNLSEGGGDSEGDALFDEAVAFVTEGRRVSISSVQRKFKIGYNRGCQPGRRHGSIRCGQRSRAQRRPGSSGTTATERLGVAIHESFNKSPLVDYRVFRPDIGDHAGHGGRCQCKGRSGPVCVAQKLRILPVRFYSDRG